MLFALLLEEFGEDRGATALAGALLIGTMLCANGLQGYLQKRFSLRQVTGLGTVIATCGLLLSAGAQAVWNLSSIKRGEEKLDFEVNIVAHPFLSSSSFLSKRWENCKGKQMLWIRSALCK